MRAGRIRSPVRGLVSRLDTRYNRRVEFADAGTRDVYNGRSTRQARSLLPAALVPLARRKLTMLAAAVSLDSLRLPPGNRLEALRGDRAGQHSIRINDQYRICFRWADGEAVDVEIVDYH